MDGASFCQLSEEDFQQRAPQVSNGVTERNTSWNGSCPKPTMKTHARTHTSINDLARSPTKNEKNGRLKVMWHTTFSITFLPSARSMVWSLVFFCFFHLHVFQFDEMTQPLLVFCLFTITGACHSSVTSSVNNSSLDSTQSQFCLPVLLAPEWGSNRLLGTYIICVTIRLLVSGSPLCAACVLRSASFNICFCEKKNTRQIKSLVF